MHQQADLEVVLEARLRMVEWVDNKAKADKANSRKALHQLLVMDVNSLVTFPRAQQDLVGVSHL